ncbi:flagellar export protein FliJ [Chthonomonas calidirosea]|uniref:flagellar export protein FliJ n=1 Tax=Chthonomonas calidirosea TaxID=454171 RepID=UPI0006EC5365|nr:flagellar export protein FliJ [Chthonomonas calidirosea]CEK12413.1 flagellar export protein FliJ [Chthonomonas calidirosea]
MRRFTFRLQTVLNYRHTIEQLREQEFTAAQGRLALVQAHLAQLRAEFQQTLALRPGALPGERFDAASIADRERYLQTLQTAIEEQQRRLDAAQIVVEEKRTALVEARRAREVVEQLYNKELANYKLQLLQLEQKMMDDLATMRHHLPHPLSLPIHQEEAA